MEIIGLRDRLVKIINDYLLQTSLSEGCREIFNKDCLALQQKLFSNLRTPMRMEPNKKRCSSCNGQIVSQTKKITGVISFYCGHSYHQHCLKGGEDLNSDIMKSTGRTIWCTICQDTEKSRKG